MRYSLRKNLIYVKNCTRLAYSHNKLHTENSFFYYTVAGVAAAHFNPEVESKLCGRERNIFLMEYCWHSSSGILFLILYAESKEKIEQFEFIKLYRNILLRKGSIVFDKCYIA